MIDRFIYTVDLQCIYKLNFKPKMGATTKPNFKTSVCEPTGDVTVTLSTFKYGLRSNLTKTGE